MSAHNHQYRLNSSARLCDNRTLLRPNSDHLPQTRHAEAQDGFRKYLLRRGPTFVLCRRIDTSRLQPNGKLIRSARLARLEAVLLVAGGPLQTRKLIQLAGLVDGDEVQELIDLLNLSYDRSDSSFRIERTANGFQLMTRPVLVSWLDRLHQRQAQMKLSPPALETLTIIAYQQPVTRAGVEAIRGVQSTDMIRQLIDRGLVRVGGEEDSLGKPFLYITTRKFLDMFGLGRIEDLPDFDTLGRTPDLNTETSVLNNESADEDTAAEETAA